MPDTLFGTVARDFFFAFFYILTNTLDYIQVYMCFEGARRVRMNSDNQNGPLVLVLLIYVTQTNNYINITGLTMVESDQI